MAVFNLPGIVKYKAGSACKVVIFIPALADIRVAVLNGSLVRKDKAADFQALHLTGEAAGVDGGAGAIGYDKSGTLGNTCASHTRGSICL